MPDTPLDDANVATHHMLYPDDRWVTSDWTVAAAIDRYTDVLIEHQAMTPDAAATRARDEFMGHVRYAKFYLSDNGDTTWER